MAYVSPNFKTKKAFKEAVKEGRPVKLFEPKIGTIPENGIVCVEGPHFPEPHKWYANVTIENGKITKVT